MRRKIIPDMRISVIYLVITLAGGCMDAYSYFCRGKVLANAQTGNIFLCCVYLSESNFPMVVKYLIPVLSFAAGVLISDAIFAFLPEKNRCRQVGAVAAEAAVLLAVGFLPQSLNTLANALTSLACAVQLESFRSLQGNSVATTMCIGNLRSGVNNLFQYIKTKNKSFARKSQIYFGIIISFVTGAVIESKLIKAIGEYGIIFAVVVLCFDTVLILTDKNKT